MLNQAPATPNYGKPSPALVTPETSIGMLAYRSRAVRPPGPGELEALVRQAQARNRIEGLTGLLIYDQGCFFQWLEGPTTGLARVWDSISRDPRHYECQILREQFMPRRFFGAWDMRLTTRTRGSTDLSLSSPELVQMPQLWNTRPARLSAEIWDEIFADMVLPKLFARHRPMLPAAASAAIAWHARGETPAELAGLLLALDAGATADYVDALVAQGADLDTLYREVFEPAARVVRSHARDRPHARLGTPATRSTPGGRHSSPSVAGGAAWTRDPGGTATGRTAWVECRDVDGVVHP